MVLLLVEIALRARYPWDLLLWSESPFMTNVLKLHAGQPVFSPPADVNSFVYSPGLEYLTYALLAPFGRALDVRFCRVVNVALGLVAAAVAASIAMRVATVLGTGRSRRMFWALACGATLVVFRNFTADVLHPDNLQMLHATLTLLLSFEAAVSCRFGVALAAVVVAGVGVWAKQVEVFSVVGATVAVLSARWSPGRALAIVATGAAATAVAVAVLLALPFARFYLFDLLLAQVRQYGIGFPKLFRAAEPFFFGHRLLLLCLAVDGGRRLWQSGGELGRRYLLAWAAIGATTAAPCLSAYVKPMGLWNNLVLLDVWAFLLVAPALVAHATAAVGLESRFRWALVLALLVTLCPAKLPPTTAMYAYGAALDSAIQADVAAGRDVLLAHGTMPLIRAGATVVPLDRANSTLELLAGGRDTDLRAMGGRFHDRVYDRIYVNSGWYGMMLSAISDGYRETDVIAPAELLPAVPLSLVLLAGHDRLLERIRIYVPKS